MTFQRPYQLRMCIPSIGAIPDLIAAEVFRHHSYVADDESLNLPARGGYDSQPLGG